MGPAPARRTPRKDPCSSESGEVHPSGGRVPELTPVSGLEKPVVFWGPSRSGTPTLCVLPESWLLTADGTEEVVAVTPDPYLREMREDSGPGTLTPCIYRGPGEQGLGVHDSSHVSARTSPTHLVGSLNVVLADDAHPSSGALRSLRSVAPRATETQCLLTT